MQTIPVYAPLRSEGEEWRETFPRRIVTFIGVIQMFLTWGILACETISMLNGFGYGFLFIGYGTSFFYIIAWISIYGSRKSQYYSLSDSLYDKKAYYIFSLSIFF